MSLKEYIRDLIQINIKKDCEYHLKLNHIKSPLSMQFHIYRSRDKHKKQTSFTMC